MRIENFQLSELKFKTEMNGRRRPIALVIIDGWGYSPRTEGNAIALAHTPFYDEICAKFPKTTLVASGLRVGLTPDMPGSRRAEARLAAGTYGLSVESGEPIPDERLEAIPTAERTAEEERRG